jgi:hypothetical protein
MTAVAAAGGVGRHRTDVLSSTSTDQARSAGRAVAEHWSAVAWWLPEVQFVCCHRVGTV